MNRLADNRGLSLLVAMDVARLLGYRITETPGGPLTCWYPPVPDTRDTPATWWPSH